MKRCPFCGEEIKVDAIKCKHCKEFLDGRSHDATGTPQRQNEVEDSLWCPNCKKKVRAQITEPGCGGAVTLRCPLCAKTLKQRCCFIASCAFGSFQAPEVVSLSKFRDEVLLKYQLGRWLEEAYYHAGPYMVKCIETIPFLKNPIRYALRMLILKLPQADD